METICYFVFSGQAAVITPRQVTFGLGSRRVKAVAAAKHHTVIATDGGEVFSWGSNRGKSYGGLKYTEMLTTPKFIFPKLMGLFTTMVLHRQ